MRNYLKDRPKGLPPLPKPSKRKRPKFDALNKSTGIPPPPLPPRFKATPCETSYPLPAPKPPKMKRYDKVGRPPSPLNRAVLELEPGESREVSRVEHKVRRTLFRKDALLRRLYPDREFVIAASPNGTRIWRIT